MTPLTVELLARACRIFLALSYPEGENTVPPSRRPYLHIAPDQPLEPLLGPPVCEVVPTLDGRRRGYALRLGSATYPHLKLQVIDCDGCWVFGVDTHDAITLDPCHPSAARLAELQAANRCLKERIEPAWEAEGLLTFNALLRQQLGQA